MALRINLPAENVPSGWILVESSLGSGGNGRRYISSLLVKRRSDPGETERLLLPVMPDGRIYELIKLPDDMTSLVWQLPDSGQFDQPRLSMKRVGRVERAWRMANRVLKTYMRLAKDQRRESGLSLRKALRDLPGAYRVASGFRIRNPQWNYAEWIEHFDVLSDQDCRRIREHIARFSSHPHFCLLLVADAGGREALQTTLASLRGQFYQNFTCVVLDCSGELDASFDPDVELKNAGMGSCVVAQDAVAGWLADFGASLAGERAGEWLMLLRAGDTLPAHSLYWFACEVLARPDAVIVYSDDDSLDADGRRCHPRFKPDWSLTHLRSTHYVGESAILRGEAVVAGGVQLNCCRYGNYDLLLRVVDCAGEEVAHIPVVLFHRRSESIATLDPRAHAIYLPQAETGLVGTDAAVRAGDDGHPDRVTARAQESAQWQLNALLAHLARNGVAAEVSEARPGYRRVRYRLPARPPLVSIIVPTRDALPMIRRCMESLWEKTTYPRFEVLVVDNRSANPRTLAYLAKIARRPGVQVLRYNRPFNYSAINNLAVRHARGAVLSLLNNDTEVISPDWLEEMVGHLLQPRVGVVGAKLYYPDGHVQHAGVTVGPGGCANHLHAFISRDDPGYCGRAVTAQELSAVTGACMVTWRNLYLRLGGMNESRFKVAFNDVDYCLRVREAGYRVAWTPHAELVHHESATRGRDDSLRKQVRAQREIRQMRTRWREHMRYDPYYNLNFSYRRADFSLSESARVKKPWLE